MSPEYWDQPEVFRPERYIYIYIVHYIYIIYIYIYNALQYANHILHSGIYPLYLVGSVQMRRSSVILLVIFHLDGVHVIVWVQDLL